MLKILALRSSGRMGDLHQYIQVVSLKNKQIVSAITDIPSSFGCWHWRLERCICQSEVRIDQNE